MLPLDRPRIMGILNATPDSFSDGGCWDSVDAALSHASRLLDEGADMLDIGGESTRPGAARVGEGEQISRVVPVIRAIRGAGIDAPISVDTTRARVARAALDAGADAVNDVSGLTDDDAMAPLAGERGCGVVLMHRLTTPERDSYSDAYGAPPEYADVVSEVGAALRASMGVALAHGVASSSIVLDPGLGFGKSVLDNMRLIERTHELAALGRPVLSGLSRKSFVGRAGLGRGSEPGERDGASVGLSVVHLLRGARVFRVHAVGAHRAALDASWSAMLSSSC